LAQIDQGKGPNPHPTSPGLASHGRQTGLALRYPPGYPWPHGVRAWTGTWGPGKARMRVLGTHARIANVAIG
jgi:hypothetical protein